MLLSAGHEVKRYLYWLVVQRQGGDMNDVHGGIACNGECVE